MKGLQQDSIKTVGLGLLRAQKIILNGCLSQIKTGKVTLKTSYALEQFSIYWSNNRTKMMQNPSGSDKQREIDSADIKRIKILRDLLLQTILQIKKKVGGTQKSINTFPVDQWIDYFEELEQRYSKGLANCDLEAIKKEVSKEKLDWFSIELAKISIEK